MAVRVCLILRRRINARALVVVRSATKGARSVGRVTVRRRLSRDDGTKESVFRPGPDARAPACTEA